MRNSKTIKVSFAIVVCVLAFLTWAIPSFQHARVTATKNSCICNLRQIDGATQQWALENHKTTNDVPTWTSLVRYLRNSVRCPQGGVPTHSAALTASLSA